MNAFSERRSHTLAETNKAAGDKQKPKDKTSSSKSSKSAATAAKTQLKPKHKTPTPKSTNRLLKEDFGIKCNSELSFGILQQFKNPRKDSTSVSRYTATCKLCVNAKDTRRNPTISYQKGNNSNLKSHLNRVRLISIRVFVWVCELARTLTIVNNYCRCRNKLTALIYFL